MCMRMGSDAGRDFLSTDDPVKKKLSDVGEEAVERKAKSNRPVRFTDILEQYFKRRNRK